MQLQYGDLTAIVNLSEARDVIGRGIFGCASDTDRQGSTVTNTTVTVQPTGSHRLAPGLFSCISCLAPA